MTTVGERGNEGMKRFKVHPNRNLISLSQVKVDALMSIDFREIGFANSSHEPTSHHKETKIDYFQGSCP